MKRADDDWSLPPFGPLVHRLPRVHQTRLVRRRIVEQKEKTSAPPPSPEANNERLTNETQSRKPAEAALALSPSQSTEPTDGLSIPYFLLREKPPVGISSLLAAWGASVNLRAMLRDAPLSVRIDFLRTVVEPELVIRETSDKP